LDLNHNVSSELKPGGEAAGKGAGKDEESAVKILHCLEKLRLGDINAEANPMHQSQRGPSPTDPKSAIDYSSGDVQQDFALDLNLSLPDENFSGMACARIFDSKRRSVQWKREVDVIYYAGDSNGGDYSLYRPIDRKRISSFTYIYK
jgi:hypothetical protein